MGCVCPQGEEELHWQSFPSRVLVVSSFVTIFQVSAWTQKRVEIFLLPQVVEMSPVQPICMGLALSRLPVSSGKLCVEGKEGDLECRLFMQKQGSNRSTCSEPDIVKLFV